MALSEAARKARAKYMREWRAKNPEKAKAAQQRYIEKDPDRPLRNREAYWERKARLESLEQ